MRFLTRFGNSFYFFSASAALACGSSFTASDGVDVYATAPDPRSDAYLDQMAPGTGVWTHYAMPLIQSAFSGSTMTITIHAGTTGAPFTGTIWFDDLRIQ